MKSLIKFFPFAVLPLVVLITSIICWEVFFQKNHKANLFKNLKIGETQQVPNSIFGPGNSIEISNLPNNLPYHQSTKAQTPRKWPPYSPDDKAFYWDFGDFDMILIFSKEGILIDKLMIEKNFL